jgi:hypothetical protein
MWALAQPAPRRITYFPGRTSGLIERPFAESSISVGVELRRLASLERVDAGALLVAPLERRQPGGRHPPLLDQLLRAPGVHRAPDAARLARREADRVAVAVDAAAHAVDPAEAQRLVHRLGPGDARQSTTLLVEADEQLAVVGVVGLEPRTEVRRRGEEGRLHQATVAGSCMGLARSYDTAPSGSPPVPRP